jgi:hypothetical protein
VAPAEPQQVVEQGFGQDAQLVAIGIDAQRAVALGQLGAVVAVDQRDMGIDRLGPAHRTDDGSWRKALLRWSSPRITWVTPMS